MPPAAAGTSACAYRRSLYVRVETLMVSPSHSSFLPTLLVCGRRVCQRQTRLACRAQSRQCRVPPHTPPPSLWRRFLHPASGTIIRHTRRTDLYFRNYHSHCAQNKPPLSASAAGVGYFPLADREGPYSPFTPLWRRFLHPASGTNIRTARKPRPRRCLCTGAGTHRLQKRNALPLGRTLSQTGFIDLLSADA